MNPALLAWVAILSLIFSRLAISSPLTDFHTLAKQCVPDVSSETLAPIVQVESHFDPFQIGVVGGRLARQPVSKEEAVATARALEAAGHKFSAGIGQIFLGNWAAYGLNSDTVFEPCANLRASSGIFKDCLGRAKTEFANEHLALQAAYSCYYSNNFTAGFKADVEGQPSYVEKVSIAALQLGAQTPAVAQAIPFIANDTAVKGVSHPATSQTPVLHRPAGPEQVVFTEDDVSPVPVGETLQSETPGPVQLQAESTLNTKQALTPSMPKKISPYVYPSRSTGVQEASSAMVY